MEDLTVKELNALITEQGLTEKLEAFAESVNKKPERLTKAELRKVIDGQDAPVAIEATKEEKTEMTVRHNDTKVMCIVTDHYTVSKFEQNVPNRVFEVSYGNKLGSVRARVSLNGSPQYLTIATLRKLEEIKMPRLGLDANGKEVATLGNKRFSVVIVDGWTDEQLEAQKKVQATHSI